MTAWRTLLTAEAATKRTEASRELAAVFFDPVLFKRMKSLWDLQIRSAAEAGDRSIVIATPCSSNDTAAESAFIEHFTKLGFHVTIESFVVPSNPVHCGRRLRVVVSWETEAKPEKN